MILVAVDTLQIFLKRVFQDGQVGCARKSKTAGIAVLLIRFTSNGRSKSQTFTVTRFSDPRDAWRHEKNSESRTYMVPSLCTGRKPGRAEN